MSGELYAPLVHDTKDISLLENNMFSCPYGVPETDPITLTYSCGSDVLNQSLYFSFISLFIIFIISIGILLVQFRFPFIKAFISNIKHWISLSKDATIVDDYVARSDNSISYFIHILGKLRMLILGFTVYIIVVLLPAFTILSTKHRTFYYQYGWVVSGFFFTGESAAVCNFFLFGLLVIIVDYLSYYIVVADKQWKESVRDNVRVVNEGEVESNNVDDTIRASEVTTRTTRLGNTK